MAPVNEKVLNSAEYVEKSAKKALPELHSDNGNGNGNKSTSYSYETLVETANFLLSRTSVRPHIGIICGSGLGSLAEHIEEPDSVDYEEIPNFPVSTVEGHHGRLVFGKISGVPVVAMQGRFHYYEGYPLWMFSDNTFKNYYIQDNEDEASDEEGTLAYKVKQAIAKKRPSNNIDEFFEKAKKKPKCCLPIRVMKLLGVKTLIATNAAGGLNPNYKIGDLMIVKDHINMMGFAGNNPLHGPNDERFGPRFPPMNKAYNLEYRKIAKEVAKELNIENIVREGVYTCLGGPNFETVAELKMLQMVGVDAVGMSTVHEVIIARHCDMNVFGMSLVTNECVTCEHATDEANHEEVLDVGRMRQEILRKYVSQLVKRFAAVDGF